MTKHIRNVILDVDGTLIDSNDAHAHAWVQALEEYGFHTSFERVRPLIGMGGDKVLPEVAGVQKESELGRQISQRRKTLLLSCYLPHLRAFPGAWDLLQQMHQQGLTLGVASSSEQDELNALLKIINACAPQLLGVKTSAQDVPRSKPDPDVICVALRKMKARSEETIMIGDTPYDIEAAAQAGIPIIAFRCGGWSDCDLRGAIAVYDGPADLLAHYQTSPLVQT
jgi:HAD superfamily hydrolase (TIGR01509 family)